MPLRDKLDEKLLTVQQLRLWKSQPLNIALKDYYNNYKHTNAFA